MPPTTTETQLRRAVLIRGLLLIRPMGVQEIAERLEIQPRVVQRLLAGMRGIWPVQVERRGRNLVYWISDASPARR